MKDGAHTLRAGEAQRAASTLAPGLGWLTIFLFVPLLGIVALSFAGKGTYGNIEWRFTLENFARFFGVHEAGFDPLYPVILVRSLAIAAATTLFCTLAALPLTFFIARLPGRAKNAALILVIIPFWTNLLVRTYAWQILLAEHGTLARLAGALGLVTPGDALYPSGLAVFIVLVCDFLPFMALPLYASVEKIDWAVAEAASDLGADRLRVFWHALLPQIRPGLFAGALLVFVGAAGQFVIPDLMGGAKTVLLGNAIQQQFGFGRNWPFGAAIACSTMVIVLLCLWLFSRVAGSEARRRLL